MLNGIVGGSTFGPARIGKSAGLEASQGRGQERRLSQGLHQDVSVGQASAFPFVG